MKIIIVFLLLMYYNVKGADVITYASDGDRIFEWAGNKYSITELKNYFIRYRADWVSQNLSTKKEMILFDEGFNLIIKAIDSQGFGRDADGSWQNTAGIGNMTRDTKKTTRNAIGLAATYLNYIMDNYMHPIQTYNNSTYTPSNMKVIMYIIDNPNKAQIRSYPDINSTIIYSCSSGTKVTVLEQTDNLFWKVSVNGYTGYISKNWLTAIPSLQTPTNNANQYYSQGIETLKQNNYKDALELFNKAFNAGYTESEIYILRASTYIKLGIETNNTAYFYAAINDCNNYLKSNPENEFAFFSRGFAKFFLDDQTFLNDMYKGGERGSNFLNALKQEEISNSNKGQTQRKNKTSSTLKKKSNFKID